LKNFLFNVFVADNQNFITFAANILP
jgi:hypothetical protein